MEEILSKVRNLRSHYMNGHIERLHQHEVHPDIPKESRDNYIYFTLPVSINFQRSSPNMWKSALRTFEDPQTLYLFNPEKVVTTERSVVQKDLLKYGLGLLKEKHTDIWITLSTTFQTQFKGNPRNLFEMCHNDVTEIINTLQGDMKPQFPYLSGPKMANYWLYILNQYTDIHFNNLHKISIIPDTHVRQASVRLGLTLEDFSPEEVAQAWFQLLEGTDIIPIDMHPILWNWSRAGFIPDV